MSENQGKKKNWFGLINETVLSRSGPGRNNGLVGNDLTQPGALADVPGDDLTVDTYAQAQQLRRK